MKYLILGAGPAGLTVANCLKRKGIDSFLILEKEDFAGGLCRSENVDGSPIDLGGGHFLDVRRPDVNKFLFQFMPIQEWNKFERKSRIAINDDVVVDYPIESNIWQMPVSEQIEYLMSISKAGCNNEKRKPKEFSDWIIWKLGDKIANNYLIPYNRKMWSIELDQLGTYWMEKLPDVSFRDTLMSCLEHRAYANIPGHAQFYYPKSYGYGELWRRMADNVLGNIEYDTDVQKIDFDRREVNGVYRADTIINTVPWTSICSYQGVDERFLDSLKKLQYTSLVVRYYNADVNTDAHWIYFPEIQKSYHRILFRRNFLKNARGYWTETNLKRENFTGKEWYYINKYAYPINTLEKEEAINHILSFAKKKNVIGLGRWGEWQHYNSDVVVGRAMELVGKLEGGGKR